jgi:hypothetical protein
MLFSTSVASPSRARSDSLLPSSSAKPEPSVGVALSEKIRPSVVVSPCVKTCESVRPYSVGRPPQLVSSTRSRRRESNRVFVSRSRSLLAQQPTGHRIPRAGAHSAVDRAIRFCARLSRNQCHRRPLHSCSQLLSAQRLRMICSYAYQSNRQQRDLARVPQLRHSTPQQYIQLRTCAFVARLDENCGNCTQGT